MTPPDPQQVAEIAGRLSKAQREAVLACDLRWKRATGPGKGLYKSVALRPLIEGEWSIHPVTNRYRQRVRLNLLGLAVRNFIQGKSNAD